MADFMSSFTGFVGVLGNLASNTLGFLNGLGANILGWVVLGALIIIGLKWLKVF